MIAKTYREIDNLESDLKNNKILLSLYPEQDEEIKQEIKRIQYKINKKYNLIFWNEK